MIEQGEKFPKEAGPDAQNQATTVDAIVTDAMDRFGDNLELRLAEFRRWLPEFSEPEKRAIRVLMQKEIDSRPLDDNSQEQAVDEKQVEARYQEMVRKGFTEAARLENLITTTEQIIAKRVELARLVEEVSEDLKEAESDKAKTDEWIAEYQRDGAHDTKIAETSVRLGKEISRLKGELERLKFEQSQH